NNELRNGREVNFATASFGQGIEMNPIQLVRAFCALANGGKLVRPYLVDKIVENDKVTETKPEISEPIISQATVSQISAMLVSVVVNGYGKAAGIPGYYIGGKTGTAQVPEGGTYSADKTIQSFIGYAPAFDPKFVILVKLDNPKAKTAEYSATPIFHDMAEYIINYQQIIPDYKTK
ncbi:MAG: penicillin-binding transpeptidase domain-containing protein, partial [Patescibacteria group bacterium]